MLTIKTVGLTRHFSHSVSVDVLDTVVFETLLVELKRADTSVVCESIGHVCPFWFFFLDSKSFQEESGSKRDASFIATTAHYCSYLLLTGH